MYPIVSKPIQDSKYLRDNISVYFGNRVTNVSNNVTRVFCDSNQSSGTKSNALFNATNLSRIQFKRLQCLLSQFCSKLKGKSISTMILIYLQIYQTPKVASQSVLQGINQECKQVVIDSKGQNKWAKTPKKYSKTTFCRGGYYNNEVVSKGFKLGKNLSWVGHKVQVKNSDNETNSSQVNKTLKSEEKHTRI